MQLLLASPHRTLNPEEADMFYVPAYVTCFAWPIHGWADYPWWYSEGGWCDATLLSPGGWKHAASWQSAS
jgi:hypothetical protein